MRYGMILPVAAVSAVAFSIERGIFMARKSRKHKYKEEQRSPSLIAVGYIRLSVVGKEKSSSIENQKFIIERWGEQQQLPISHYYIDNGFSGKFSDRPAFQEMIQDILSGNINYGTVSTLELSCLIHDVLEALLPGLMRLAYRISQCLRLFAPVNHV